MTYIQLVNQVLLRLRENEVASVSENGYSKLIGVYVNQAKEMVEDSWLWQALKKQITFDTSDGVYSYTFDTSNSGGQLYGKYQPLSLYNASKRYEVKQVPAGVIIDQLQRLSTTNKGLPYYYGMAGIDANGYASLLVWPIPDDIYSMDFYVYQPQDELTNDTDRLIVPSLPVILAATAMALEERGEDTGQSPNTYWQQYQHAVGAAIIRDTEAATNDYSLNAGQL